MRLLTIVALLAFTSATAVAADKDEDKAKEVATAFMKAVKAKDIDTVMKTVDVPFLSYDDDKGIEHVVIDKVEKLKADLKAKLDGIKDADKIPTDAGDVLDLPAIRKKTKKTEEEFVKKVEAVVGDKGYAVMLKKGDEKRGAVFVRVKDCQAKVVGIAP